MKNDEKNSGKKVLQQKWKKKKLKKVKQIGAMDKIALEKEIQELEIMKTNTDDFGLQMEIADKIHNIKMKINGVKPTDSHIDCIGCGS